jgi:hypothetical protein
MFLLSSFTSGKFVSKVSQILESNSLAQIVLNQDSLKPKSNHHHQVKRDIIL